jgi:tetratricopeptide (TPR) repeat protein
MRRLAIAAAMLLALSAHAEKWSDSYKRGIALINAHSYAAGIEAMQQALAEMPNESAGVRVRNEQIVYVPHYWIGVAKFSSGDADGALREFRASEEQGVIQNTDYYARLREWVSRANGEKSKAAQSGVADVRKTADAAVSRAMSTQMDALAAGADRSENYRSAQRLLQEARDQLRSGADARGYRRAADAANQARDLFASAADAARRAKAARPIPVRAAEGGGATSPPPPTPTVIQHVAPPRPATPPVEAESEALVSARIALQQFRRDVKSPKVARQAAKMDALLRAHPDPATIQATTAFVEAKKRELAPAPAPTTAPAPTPNTKPDLTAAYRAYAHGDLEQSVALLTSMIDAKPSGEAFLLRGCARYTAAVLARKDINAAADDFKAALRLNRALRLDEGSFSPKLIAYFEQVRAAR